MDEPIKLTVKEQRFVNAYLSEASGNGAEAARRAGYAEKSARVTASQLLTKPNIRAHIDAVLMAEAMTPAEILHELRDVGTAEWRDFVTVKYGGRDADGNDKIIDVRMDLSAKMKALELNGKYHKMFVDNLEMSGSQTVFVREYREGDPQPRKDEPDGGGL